MRIVLRWIVSCTLVIIRKIIHRWQGKWQICNAYLKGGNYPIVLRNLYTLPVFSVFQIHEITHEIPRICIFFFVGTGPKRSYHITSFQNADFSERKNHCKEFRLYTMDSQSELFAILAFRGVTTERAIFTSHDDFKISVHLTHNRSILTVLKWHIDFNAFWLFFVRCILQPIKIGGYTLTQCSPHGSMGTEYFGWTHFSQTFFVIQGAPTIH